MHDTSPSTPLAPLAHSMDDAARLLGVSRRMIAELIARGELGSIKIGRRRVIPRTAINRYLAGREAV